VAKWQAEALSGSGRDITEAMVKWCIEELRFKVPDFLKTGSISVYNGDVVKSDSAIPLELKEELKNAAAPLEQVPEWQKDWHPESDEKVLDLVHPSLFPLVYVEKAEFFPIVLSRLTIVSGGPGRVWSFPFQSRGQRKKCQNGNTNKQRTLTVRSSNGSHATWISRVEKAQQSACPRCTANSQS
jgi:hypothetical protein